MSVKILYNVQVDGEVMVVLAVENEHTHVTARTAVTTDNARLLAATIIQQADAADRGEASA